MNIKTFLFDDDRGVSPVIGVILMVAITVILAAVIAAFVLGLGDTNSTAPSVTWDYDYDESDGTLTITNTGGDSFDPARVELQFDGLDDTGTDGSNGTLSSVELDATSSDDADVSSTSISDPSQAGQSVTIDLTGDNGNGPNAGGTTDFELDITFTSEDGGTSSTIGGTTGPDA
jgi:flagellin-like protein